MVLGDRGDVRARIAVTATMEIVDADATRVWAVDVDADGLASIVVLAIEPR